MTIRILSFGFGLLVLTACTKNEKVALPEQAVNSEKAAAPAAEAAAPVAAAPVVDTSPAEAPPAAVVDPSAPPPAAPAGGATAAAAAPAAVQQQNAQTRLSGEVSSTHKSSLAFRVTGFIREIRRKTGDACKKGDVLATLDDRDYKLAQDIARAQRDVAQVTLGNARSEFEREEELRRQNVSTEAMFDKLKASFDKARLDLQLADLNLKKAEQAMQDTKLMAPYNCVISKQLKYVGENLQSGNAVFEIYDTTDAELSFAVPERMAGKVKVGDSLNVTIPATGFNGPLAIIRLVPVVEESSRTFRIITQAPTDQKVVPGLYAEAVLK